MKKSILFIVGIALGAISVFVFAATYVNVPAKGTIHRAFVEYYDTDTISIMTGYGECNGSYFEITNAVNHDMTSLATGEDFHYIYIDDSASDYPDPNIIDSTTEPTWTDTKMGWYNGDDRCIGVVWSPASTATLWSFVTNSKQKYWGDYYLKASLLSVGNPNGAAQTLEATAYIPVNAVAVNLYAGNTDTSDRVRVSVTPVANEGIRLGLTDCGYEYGQTVGWIDLKIGSSRDLEWTGDDNDNNSFNINIVGYQIER